MRFRDRVVVVTGAGSGFGRVTTARFAEEGAKVVIADVDEAGARATADLARGAGTEAHVEIADVATADGAIRTIRAALDAFGALDVLVNNAGISQTQATDTWNCSEATWDELLRVDLKSVYLCCRAAIPTMLERGRGAIVNVASIAASVPCGGAAYSAAKGGIVSYTRVVAAELAPHGVRINCVSPGFMRTPMSTGERRGLSLEEQDARVATMAAPVPIGKAGMPIDIAEAILYLAGDEAGYVTGQELVVDGGYVVR